jgi:hypothetical protein
MISAMRSFIRREDGIAGIEMALILPFFFLMFFGLLDLTGLISHNRKITTVASAVADIVSQNNRAVLKTDINDYFKIATLVMKPTSDSTVRIIVRGYRKTGTNPPAQIWSVDNGKGPSCGSAPDAASMTALMTAGNDLIVTQSCAIFKPYMGMWLGDELLGTMTPKVEQTVVVRPRVSATLNCFATVVNGAGC